MKDSREVARHLINEMIRYEVDNDTAVDTICILMASYGADAIDRSGQSTVEFTCGDFQGDIKIRVSRE